MGINSWFKHYNTALEGQFLGDLIANKEYDAVVIVFAIMELISRFEDENNRGYASVPIDRIARLVNMKPSRIDRLLARISLVSRSDLKCEVDAEQTRNRSFLMRNWLKYQETRGGKRLPKTEQKVDRRKKEEVRSKNTPKPPLGFQIEISNLEILYQNYPRKEGKSVGFKRLLNAIKSQKDFDDFLLAVKNYSAMVADKEINFIKQFSSFVGTPRTGEPWRDYIKQEITSPKKIRNLDEELQ